MSPREKEFTERINVFFTPEQIEQIKCEASKVGLTVSAYVRMTVLNKTKNSNPSAIDVHNRLIGCDSFME